MTRIETHWRVLFDHALHLLDELQSREGRPRAWTFGGGTAMMLQINHRLSFDVDFFTPDHQIPKLVGDLVQGRYVEPGQGYKVGDNYIKIVFEGLGKIDFITANNILADHTRPANVRGREILLETIPEIITKKVFYRGEEFVPRDIFDIAAACHAGYRDELVEALSQIPAEFEAFAGQLDKEQQNSGEFEQLLTPITILSGFESVQTDALAIIQGLVDDTRAKLDNPPTSDPEEDAKPASPAP